MTNLEGAGRPSPETSNPLAFDGLSPRQRKWAGALAKRIVDTLEGRYPKDVAQMNPADRERHLGYYGGGAAALRLYDQKVKSPETGVVFSSAIGVALEDEHVEAGTKANIIATYLNSQLFLSGHRPSVEKLKESSQAQESEPLRQALANYFAFRNLAQSGVVEMDEDPLH